MFKDSMVRLIYEAMQDRKRYYFKVKVINDNQKIILKWFQRYTLKVSPDRDIRQMR